MFFCCVFDALSTTMATFAGQNLGAGKIERISEGLKASSAWERFTASARCW